jgi:hypothetical protein
MTNASYRTIIDIPSIIIETTYHRLDRFEAPDEVSNILAYEAV